MRILGAGFGGFIGGHMARRLLDDGHELVCVDIKPLSQWYQVHEDAHRNLVYDLKRDDSFKPVFGGKPFDTVINLSADMGGMGFLHNNRVETLHSVDITSNVIRWAYETGCPTLLYASSACVYNDALQQTEIVSLKESDAWPADPEPAYGLEKLYGEEFCKWYRDSKGMDAKPIRLHNVYGPYGTYKGGREKAPAALAYKTARAVLSGNHEIEIWGDGEQTRSFMYVDDCVEGFMKIWNSSFNDPINLGSSELVTINQMVDILEDIAGVKLTRKYDLTAPQGVRGRNSDNTLIKSLFGWSPGTKLRDGLEQTYRWIYDELKSGN